MEQKDVVNMQQIQFFVIFRALLGFSLWGFLPHTDHSKKGLSDQIVSVMFPLEVFLEPPHLCDSISSFHR